MDEFRCYDARDGTVRWTVRYPAPGRLDYDNSPRATPLIHGGRVYLLGAFGHLTCATLDTGAVEWQMNILDLFAGDPELVWGTCSSPLLVDGKLIVNPGGPKASVVALDPESGAVIWESPGDRHAYSSFIVATLGGVRQLVGYDRESLGGWDIATGNRLWTLEPPHDGDFNVPTPVAVDGGRLLVATENNGTRLYEFDAAGKHRARSRWQKMKNWHRTSARRRCLAIACFVFAAGCIVWTWTTVWRRFGPAKTRAFGDSSPLFVSRAASARLWSRRGVAAHRRCGRRIPYRQARMQLFADDQSRSAEQLSYPALVGTHLYLRGEHELVCVDLAPAAG